MKWTVSLPRVVAEDDKAEATVEADSIEEAIIRAAPDLHPENTAPIVGQVYNVHCRVEVAKRSSLPLRSV